MVQVLREGNFRSYIQLLGKHFRCFLLLKKRRGEGGKIGFNSYLFIRIFVNFALFNQQPNTPFVSQRKNQKSPPRQGLKTLEVSLIFSLASLCSFSTHTGSFTQKPKSNNGSHAGKPAILSCLSMFIVCVCYVSRESDVLCYFTLYCASFLMFRFFYVALRFDFLFRTWNNVI